MHLGPCLPHQKPKWSFWLLTLSVFQIWILMSFGEWTSDEDPSLIVLPVLLPNYPFSVDFCNPDFKHLSRWEKIMSHQILWTFSVFISTLWHNQAFFPCKISSAPLTPLDIFSFSMVLFYAYPSLSGHKYCISSSCAPCLFCFLLHICRSVQLVFHLDIPD